jgi:hypothetical protein
VQKEIIEIERTCTGFHLTIDDYFINCFKSMRTLLDYLTDRLLSDFN